MGFVAELFAFFAVHFDADLIGEGVHAGAAITATVGSIGRNAFGTEDQFKDIGIVVGSYPA